MEVIFPWEHEERTDRSQDDDCMDERRETAEKEGTDGPDIESLAREIAADSDRSAAEIATSIRTLADATGKPPSTIAAALLDDGSTGVPLAAFLPADGEE